MADKVFVGTVVLPDRIIENGYVLVADGTVRAFDYEELYAKVSGFLVNQKVDIGSQVKKGDVLAQIGAPELLPDELHAKAAPQMLLRSSTTPVDLAAESKRLTADLPPLGGPVKK